MDHRDIKHLKTMFHLGTDQVSLTSYFTGPYFGGRMAPQIETRLRISLAVAYGEYTARIDIMALGQSPKWELLGELHSEQIEQLKLTRFLRSAELEQEFYEYKLDRFKEYVARYPEQARFDREPRFIDVLSHDDGKEFEYYVESKLDEAVITLKEELLEIASIM